MSSTCMHAIVVCYHMQQCRVVDIPNKCTSLPRALALRAMRSERFLALECRILLGPTLVHTLGLPTVMYNVNVPTLL